MKNSGGHGDPHTELKKPRNITVVKPALCIVMCAGKKRRGTFFYPVAVQMFWVGSAATKPHSYTPFFCIHKLVFLIDSCCIPLQIHKLYLCQFSQGQ